MDALSPASLATPGQLICLCCGQRQGCPPDDLTRYMRAKDWPRCCGRVMAFCPAADRQPTPPSGPPSADDTVV